jgi:hypothetical protein
MFKFTIWIERHRLGFLRPTISGSATVTGNVGNFLRYIEGDCKNFLGESSRRRSVAYTLGHRLVEEYNELNFLVSDALGLVWISCWGEAAVARLEIISIDRTLQVHDSQSRLPFVDVTHFHCGWIPMRLSHAFFCDSQGIRRHVFQSQLEPAGGLFHGLIRNLPEPEPLINWRASQTPSVPSRTNLEFCGSKSKVQTFHQLLCLLSVHHLKDGSTDVKMRITAIVMAG